MRLTRNKCADNEAPINHGVGEENEPAVAGALLELAACLGAANTASRIFAYIMSSVISMYYYMLFWYDQSNSKTHTSNTNTHKEAPGSQHVEHAHSIAVIVRARGQRRKDDEDDGGHEQRVGARPAVGQEAKEELADDGADKGNVRDILGGGGIGVDLLVFELEDRVDGPNDVVDVAVGEETGTAGEDRQRRLEEGLAADADFNGGFHHCCGRVSCS